MPKTIHEQCPFKDIHELTGYASPAFDQARNQSDVEQVAEKISRCMRDAKFRNEQLSYKSTEDQQLVTQLEERWIAADRRVRPQHLLKREPKTYDKCYFKNSENLISELNHSIKKSSNVYDLEFTIKKILMCTQDKEFMEDQPIGVMKPVLGILQDWVECQKKHYESKSDAYELLKRYCLIVKYNGENLSCCDDKYLSHLLRLESRRPKSQFESLLASLDQL